MVNTVITKDVTFAHTLIRTERPKLVVIEIFPGRTFKGKMKTFVENLDIFAYVNIKIYLRGDILKFNGPRYTSTLRNKNVSLETQVLKNALSLIIIASDEMTFAIRMKQLGYMAMIVAEVIYLITCIPVEVK